jgi:hypothetical protein
MELKWRTTALHFDHLSTFELLTGSLKKLSSLRRLECSPWLYHIRKPEEMGRIFSVTKVLPLAPRPITVSLAVLLAVLQQYPELTAIPSQVALRFTFVDLRVRGNSAEHIKLLSVTQLPNGSVTRFAGQEVRKGTSLVIANLLRRCFPQLQTLRYLISPNVQWSGGSGEDSYRLWKRVAKDMIVSFEIQDCSAV